MLVWSAPARLCISSFYQRDNVCNLPQPIGHASSHCHSALAFDADLTRKPLNLLNFGIQDPAPTHTRNVGRVPGP